jgi:hypothetical protein
MRDERRPVVRMSVAPIDSSLSMTVAAWMSSRRVGARVRIRVKG